MLTKTQKDILCLLLNNKEKNWSMLSLAKQLKKSYALTYNNIKNLEEKEIVRKESIAPSQIIKIHEYIPNNILFEIELERRERFLKKYSWMKVFLSELVKNADHPFFILLLFGSYAKGEEKKQSDIDLLLITKTKNDNLEKTLSQEYTKGRKSIIHIDEKDWKEMRRNTKEFNIGNEAERQHIILYGIELFFQLEQQ
ncbi:MAG: nucleotidyltransferase domain-containing protein [bacterium]|nr:nucleotidyltransferase domain-containing protein [bacterium]